MVHVSRVIRWCLMKTAGAWTCAGNVDCKGMMPSPYFREVATDRQARAGAAQFGARFGRRFGHDGAAVRAPVFSKARRRRRRSDLDGAHHTRRARLRGRCLRTASRLGPKRRCVQRTTRESSQGRISRMRSRALQPEAGSARHLESRIRPRRLACHGTWPRASCSRSAGQ